MFNSCQETSKLPFAPSLISVEYSFHIHVVIISVLYHIFHGHRLPESFCVRVPEDMMYPVLLHSEPNRRQKLGLLINRLEIQARV